MKKLINHKDQRGFSLIELVVSLLIASIIVLAIGGLMSIGTRLFHTTNTETQLQKESQIAMNQIKDIMMRAISYSYHENLVTNGDVLLIKADREKSDGVTINNNYYAVILDKLDQQLLLRKINNVDLAAMPAGSNTDLEWAKAIATSEIDATEPSLLARYMKNIKITPGDTMAGAFDGAVQITLELELSGKQFTTFTNIHLRNY